jgi:hypothetical protein
MCSVKNAGFTQLQNWQKTFANSVESYHWAHHSIDIHMSMLYVQTVVDLVDGHPDPYTPFNDWQKWGLCKCLQWLIYILGLKYILCWFHMMEGRNGEIAGTPSDIGGQLANHSCLQDSCPCMCGPMMQFGVIQYDDATSHQGPTWLVEWSTAHPVH